jgi:hypothetical protein
MTLFKTAIVSMGITFIFASVVTLLFAIGYVFGYQEGKNTIGPNIYIQDRADHET